MHEISVSIFILPIQLLREPVDPDERISLNTCGAPSPSPVDAPLPPAPQRPSSTPVKPSLPTASQLSSSTPVEPSPPTQTMASSSAAVIASSVAGGVVGSLGILVMVIAVVKLIVTYQKLKKAKL